MQEEERSEDCRNKKRWRGESGGGGGGVKLVVSVRTRTMCLQVPTPSPCPPPPSAPTHNLQSSGSSQHFACYRTPPWTPGGGRGLGGEEVKKWRRGKGGERRGSEKDEGADGEEGRGGTREKWSRIRGK